MVLTPTHGVRIYCSRPASVRVREFHTYSGLLDVARGSVVVVAQVDQVTNSPLALSRESRRWHRSRVARLPLPWAAASLTRGFGALVEVPGIAPTPTRLDTTSTRRSALLATPAGSASAWLLSRNAQLITKQCRRRIRTTFDGVSCKAFDGMASPSRTSATMSNNRHRGVGALRTHWRR